MKKYIFLSLIPLLFAPLSVFAAINTDISYGTSNSQVTELQEFLTNQGVYTGPITGSFYSLTLTAVKLFQSKEGIVPVSGYVGPITRGVINQIITTETTISEENATTTQPIVDLSVQPIVQTPEIQQNTQPAYVDIPAPIDKSAIIVHPIYTPKTQGRGPGQDMPYGQYGFEVSVLDASGNYTNGAKVVMTSDIPDDIGYTSEIDMTPGAWNKGFDYIPQTNGTKTITFTSGSLSTTETVNIQ